MAKGRVVRGWLGVVIQEITPEIAETIGVKEGILVSQDRTG
jgi:serine protease Do